MKTRTFFGKLLTQLATTGLTTTGQYIKHTLARSGLLLLVAACWLACPTQPVFGLQWINTTDGFYDVATNWNGGNVPGSSDQALFNNAAGSLILWDDGVGDTESGELRLENGAFVFTGCCGAEGIPFTHTANGRVNILNGASLVLGNLADEPMNITSTDNLDVFTSSTLTVRFGSVVTTPRNGIGFDFGTGGTATMNVDGTGSEFNVADFGFIGNGGSNGVLNITNGGSVSYGGDVAVVSAGSSINRDDSSNFSMGAGTLLRVFGNAQVNFTGSGFVRENTYNFSEGADFSSTDFFNVDRNGTLIVDGVGTTFTTNTNGGAINQWGAFNNPGATATVSNGGELNLNQFTRLGFSNSAASDATVDVLSGGTMNCEALEIGRGSVGVGALNVDGAGSNVTQAGSSALTVGSTTGGATGSGTVTISNGGTFNSGSGSSTFEGTGRLNIEGGTFVANGDFDSSTGTLNHVQGTLIIDGGTFDPTSGDYRTGTGGSETGPLAADITLRNGASALISGQLQVRSGDDLRIESGSAFSCSGGLQLWGDEDRGFVFVNGTDSELSTPDSIGVGFSTLEGTLNVSEGGIAQSGINFNVGAEGILTGDGGTLIAGSTGFINNGGLLSPGLISIFGEGRLDITGDYRQTADGGYEVDFAEVDMVTTHDLVVIDGNATLAGELSTFGSGDLYETLEVLTTTGNVIGTFDSLTGIVDSNGEALAVTYESDSVNITRAFQGDANLDGTVNVLGDAFTLVGNLGMANGAVWADGDFNGDGVVDVLGDAFALVGNLGRMF